MREDIVADGPPKIHVNECVDGRCQGEDVVQVGVIVFPACWPSVRLKEVAVPGYTAGRPLFRG